LSWRAHSRLPAVKTPRVFHWGETMNSSMVISPLMKRRACRSAVSLILKPSKRNEARAYRPASGFLFPYQKLFAHPLAQQAIFQRDSFLRAAPLAVGETFGHRNLVVDGPEGMAILAHRPNIADLILRPGQMRVQSLRRCAGQRVALTCSPTPVPELLVLALAAASRVAKYRCFAAAAAHC